MSDFGEILNKLACFVIQAAIAIVFTILTLNGANANTGGLKFVLICMIIGVIINFIPSYFMSESDSIVRPILFYVSVALLILPSFIYTLTLFGAADTLKSLFTYNHGNICLGQIIMFPLAASYAFINFLQIAYFDESIAAVDILLVSLIFFMGAFLVISMIFALSFYSIFILGLLIGLIEIIAAVIMSIKEGSIFE